MTSLADKRRENGENLIRKLGEIQGATEASVEQHITENLVLRLLEYLNNLPIDVLPYAAISQFVYSNQSPDVPYYINKLESYLLDKVNEGDENYFKCLKLIEHLELAQQQKDALFSKQEAEIVRISSLSNTISDRTTQLEGLADKVDVLQESSKNITSNFINILGIFAAILMGAFGAIQGFTSLFSNAHKLSLGKILIVSSIGGSSVVLILFLLLNAIAKLTGRTLSSSTDINETSLFKKHPTLVMVFGILITIALTGASLLLSNTQIHYAPEGFWWLVPVFWIVYFIWAYKERNLLFFLKIFKLFKRPPP